VRTFLSCQHALWSVVRVGQNRIYTPYNIWSPYMVSVYDRIFGDFPAKDAVYTPYIYGPGQPYKYNSLWTSMSRHLTVISCAHFIFLLRFEICTPVYLLIKKQSYTLSVFLQREQNTWVELILSFAHSEIKLRTLCSLVDMHATWHVWVLQQCLNKKRRPPRSGCTCSVSIYLRPCSVELRTQTHTHAKTQAHTHTHPLCNKWS
jgi:hypothetical protein